MFYTDFTNPVFRFDKQLDTLKKKMIEMSAMCEELTAKASQALLTADSSLAMEVVADGKGIDAQERDIESFCVRFLLQQPVTEELKGEAG